MTSPWSPGYGRQGHGATEQMAPSQIDGSRAGLQSTAGAGVGTATCPQPEVLCCPPSAPCPGVLVFVTPVTVTRERLEPP